MARTNLKNVKAQLEALTEAAIAQLAKERETDSAHIEQHAETSRATIIRIAEAETALVKFIEDARQAYLSSIDSLITGIRQMMHEMREEEQQRLVSLQAHADDINDDAQPPAPPVMEERVVRRIK